MNSEKIYYTNGNVTVTNSRLVVQDQTYAVSGITSVKFERLSPNRILPTILLLGGIFMPFFTKTAGILSIWHWLIVILPGVIWFGLQRTRYTVKLSSASGESRALTSKNPDFVRGVVNALNQAIIQRG